MLLDSYGDFSWQYTNSICTISIAYQPESYQNALRVESSDNKGLILTSYNKKVK